jgi:hypothetical protein
MIDPTYLEALEATEPPHRVLLGPVPCKRCGAWVEYAGVELLALGTVEPHECEPYLPVRGLQHAGEPLAAVLSRQAAGLEQPQALPQLMPWWADRLALAALVVAVVGVAAVAALALLPRS